MSGHFFDSSALVKLYHREAGTDAVEEIVDSSDGQIRISRLTPAEIASAFAIKVRTGTINREEAQLLHHRFRTDIAAGKLKVYTIGESEFAEAESLLARFAFDLRLRALDALQLAVAMELPEQDLVRYFVASDRVLCEVAQLSGFSVINPETPASQTI